MKYLLDEISKQTPNPHKLPSYVLRTIFSYLSVEDLLRCLQVCTFWNKILSDKNCDVWRHHYRQCIPIEAIRNEILVDLHSYHDRIRSFHHSWSDHDCSENMYVLPNGFTVHRRPEAQCTDMVRGKIGFTAGRHCWHLQWQGPLGTVAMVGVATQHEVVRLSGYKPLLGSSNESWAWNLVDNHVYHGGKKRGNYPNMENNQLCRYNMGEKITVILDMEDKTLSFERGSKFLGVAVTNLPQKRLFPSISAVYGNTEVTMVYKGYPLDG